MKHEEIVAQVVRDVAELPDRSSPEGWPEAMVVTGEELALIVDRALAQVEAETIERAAKVCDEIEEGYFGREYMKYPELKTDAETGARECAYEIRSLSPNPTPTKSVVPEGMVVVPRELITKLLSSVSGDCYLGKIQEEQLVEELRAMIQAAPDTDVSVSGGLIDGAIIATSAEADFSKGTWTFEPKGEWSVGAGDYYLIPVKAAPNDGAAQEV